MFVNPTEMLVNPTFSSLLFLVFYCAPGQADSNHLIATATKDNSRTPAAGRPNTLIFHHFQHFRIPLDHCHSWCVFLEAAHTASCYMQDVAEGASLAEGVAVIDTQIVDEVVVAAA